MRKFGVAVLGTFLTLFLLFAALTAIAGNNLNSTHVKKWLREGDVYQTVVSNVLDQSKKIEIGGSTGDINVDQAGLKAAIESAIAPSFLQQSTESVLDAVQQWLDGKVQLPQFSIDVAQVKAALATNIADYARSRYESLPLCGAGTAPKLESDILSINCRLLGTNIEPQLQTLQDNIQNSQDFLNENVLTADNINKLDNAQGTKENVFEQAKQVPESYQGLKKAPYIFGVLSAIIAAAIILLSASKRKGLRRVAISLLVVGLGLLLSVLLVSYGFSKGESEIKAKDSTENAIVENTVLPVIKSAKKDVAGDTLGFASVFLAISGGAFAYLYFTRPKQPGNDESNGHDHSKSSEDDKRGAPAAKPKKPKPTPTVVSG